MIISRTPMRVSFFGGGTDLLSFCNKERGAVISTSIQKYVYIIVHPSFDKKNHIAYSRVEKTDHADSIQNTRVREAMKMTGITKGIEIHSVAEVPSGTGLGGSSSFTVGLLNALYAYQGKHVSQERLAREACEIEINILKEPIGRQDQYAAAFGGLNKIEFLGDETKIKPMILGKEEKDHLQKNLMLFHLGTQELASNVLTEQNQNIQESENIFNLHIQLRDLVDEMEGHLAKNDITKFGETLHKNWLIKKQLASNISNPQINEYYEKIMQAGALGGKVLGAGGRGFLLVYANPEKQNAVRNALAELEFVDLKFDVHGSKIIYVGE